MVLQAGPLPENAVLKYTASSGHQVILPSVEKVASAINRAWNMMMSQQEAEKCARAAIREFIKSNEYSEKKD